MQSESLIEQAVSYSAEHGVPVFPFTQGKKPTTAHGFKDASRDPKLIREMFSHPKAEVIAMPTGLVTGIAVLDIDIKKDPNLPSGLEWLDANAHLIPRTRTVKSQSGGRHFYFRHVDGLHCSANKIAPGVDIRAEGGLIIVVGRGYELETDIGFGELPLFPEAILSQLNVSSKKPDRERSQAQNWALAFVPGQWHTTVRNNVASLVARGASRADVLQLAASLTMEGYTQAQTEQELAAFYDSAAAKGWTPQKATDNFAPLQFPLPKADPLPEFPDLCVPPSLQPWLTDVARRMDIPTEYIASAALVSASSIIGRRAAIRPKVKDPWEEHANLWGLVVAPPGELKSPSVNQALKPITNLERDERKRWEQIEIAYRKELTILTERESLAKKDLKDALKKGDGSEAAAKEALEELHGKVVKLQRKLAAGGRRYLCNDATTEKLAELCQANPYGLMLSRDEISGWFETLTRAGKEGDREFFLEAWSGDGGHSYDRIGRGCLYIPHVCLSLFGTIQPGKLDSLIHSAGQDGKGADGLLQRFQILLYPDRRGPRSYVDEPPDKDAQTAYNAVYKKLANDEWKSICTLETGIPMAGPDESSFHYFHFDDEAQAVATDWFIALETQIHAIEAPAFKSHIAKYRGLMPRLALNYFLIEACAGSISSQKVPVQAVRFAIAWCEVLEAHAKKLWASAINPALAPTHKLSEKILTGKVVNNMEISVIQQKRWSKLTSTDLVDLAVTQLQTWGWLRRVVRTTGGRPSSAIALNPALPIDG